MSATGLGRVKTLLHEANRRGRTQATAIRSIWSAATAGDPLRIGLIKAQFLENHSSEAEYDAGLLYAEDSDWVEVTPAPHTKPHDMLTLTVDGFAQTQT
jgi:hypothetical protein